MADAPLTILGVDPSSTCTGWALLRERRGRDRALLPELVEHGIITVKGGDKLPGTERARRMAPELITIIEQHKPDMAVVEVPSGKIAAAQGTDAWRGLPVYGYAVGYLDCTLRVTLDEGCVISVDERTWSGGAGKRPRATRIGVLFPGYDRDRDGDTKLDIADAIGIAFWFINTLERQRRTAG